ncbi:Cysteine-rich receptor-like protein kinase 10 [Morella rubra]|uniref:Cysteine-rich receptor-like protein kinase 10 n=1 Tax=Morella rubra TaxID=262757 RepID=A0A6A1V0B9_9ROSI|nr:Cysteine-rich receptor-like protein kinase 10 [Morella rubra]
MPAEGKRLWCNSSVRAKSSLGTLAVSGPLLRDRNELLSSATASPVGTQSSCAYYDRAEDRITVTSMINTAYRTHKNKMFQHYLVFNSKEETLEHPYPDMNTKEWTRVCDLFASEEFQRRSAINKENRAKLKIVHTSGARSFQRARALLVRAVVMSSIGTDSAHADVAKKRYGIAYANYRWLALSVPVAKAMNKPKSSFFQNLMKPFKFSSSKGTQQNTVPILLLYFVICYVLTVIRSFFLPWCDLSEGQNEEELDKIALQEQKLFPFETLAAATKDFQPTHKLGEGGFGPVYKGKLNDGREIAVKKLSHSSNQGAREFVNEAKLLAHVQHRNVVNLLGYCVHGVEKLLVYEYVYNESLDKLLFKSNRREELDWKRRYDIIAGIARGLLYLHEDSHNCIIHRDIKASNILLDDKWVPKIADFGMARLFPEDQTHVNTRVAGTNGYMAPEYVMHGHLSVKADVFSFGVLVLELVSSQRNSSFNLHVEAQNLLDWTDKLYKKGRSLEIMDPTLASSAVADQVAMCIQIGLLCTQGDPTLRPNMRRVVVMLSRKGKKMKEKRWIDG